MKCFYIIKLPNGGEVKIPADLTKLTPTDHLQKLLENYLDSLDAIRLQRDADADPETLSELEKVKNTHRSALIKYTNTGLNPQVVVKLGLDRDSEESLADQFVRKVNSKIDEQLTIDNLNDALYKLLKKDVRIEKKNTQGRISTISVSELLSELNKPLSTKYFSGMNVDTVLGIKSVNQYVDELKSKLDVLKHTGQPSEAIEALKEFIFYAFPNKPGVRTSESFFHASFSGTELNTSAVLEEGNERKNPIFIYNNSSELAVFLSVFSYLASKLDRESVLAIVEEFNTHYTSKIPTENFDMKKFFLGYFTDEGDFVEPGFNKMLKTKTGTKSAIDKLIDLVSDSLLNNYEIVLTEDMTMDDYAKRVLNRKKSHIKIMTLLFNQISPEKYGAGVISSLQKSLERFNKEDQENRAVRRKQKMDFLEPLITRVDYHYRQPEKIQFDTVEELQEWAENNIELFRDVLTIPFMQGKPVARGEKSTYSKFIIPTLIARTATGIKIISGFVYESGNIRELTDLETIYLKPEHLFYYRKFDNANPTDDYNKFQNVTPLTKRFPGQTIVISNPEKLPESLVRAVALPGSEVTYTYYDRKSGTEKESKRTVAIVLAGALQLNTYINKAGKQENHTIRFDRITKITTLYNEAEDSFTSAEFKSKVEQENKLNKISNKFGYLPIKKGDYIKITENGKNYHNKVLAVDGDNVYIIIKTRDAKNTTDIIKAVAQPRNKITEVYTPALNQIELEEIGNALYEYEMIYKQEKSVRKAQYSYFMTKENLQDGDLFIVTNSNGTDTVYKLLSKEHNYAVRLQHSPESGVSYYYEKADWSKASLFMTKRDIAPDDSRTIADLNNFRLVTANSEEDIKLARFEQDSARGYKLIPAKYVIPKHLASIYSPVELPSGNLDFGGPRWGSKSEINEDVEVDYTEEVIKNVNRKNGTNGSKLFLLQKESNGFIERYTKSLKEYILQDNSGNTLPYYNQIIPEIKTNCYFCFAKDFQGNNTISFSNKLFKVISVSDGEMVLEYTAITDSGKFIVIRKKVNIQEAFNQKMFKALYAPFTSKTQKAIDDIIGIIKVKPAIGNRIEFARYMGKKLANLFDIDTKLVEYDVTLPEYKKFANKKAWIESSSTDKPVVVLNMLQQGTNHVDVVHEFLHLFLLGLRYTNPKLYNKIIENYRISELRGRKLDAFTIEEKLVEKLSKDLSEGVFSDEDLYQKEQLAEGIINGIVALSEDMTDVEFANLEITHLGDLLSRPVKDVTGYNKRNILEDVKNANLVYFDSNFRDWLQKSLKDKSVKINCK